MLITFRFTTGLRRVSRFSWGGVGVGFGVLVLLSATVRSSYGQNIDGREVKRAVEAGVRLLQSRQQNGGNWNDPDAYPGGMTALCLLALIQAGVPVDTPSVADGLTYLLDVPNERTYVVGLKAQVFSLADPQRFKGELQKAVAWLYKAQLSDGSWSYTKQGRGDNSNSQFALLGLHEAARSGAKVPPTVWRKTQAYWRHIQCTDGGWHYRSKEQQGYGSMTAAAVASLLVCGSSAEARVERTFVNGVAPRCGKYRQDPAVARGLNWLAGHFTVDTNPKRGAWHYYYLYALERVGILSGQKTIGAFDWYRRGAAYLLAHQRADGSWSQGMSLADTAFAVLFLAKGHRSLLFNKLQWTKRNEWNLDRNDIANLTAFIDDKLGQPVSWQVVQKDTSLEEWLSAPILYFNGHRFPRFDATDMERIREYIRQGGTLFAEACCRRKAFAEGFREFAGELFPDSPLVKLEPEHPIFHAQASVDQTFPLEGIDVGCRTSVIFSPNDLSCLWEQGNVPKLSEKAFTLGLNIAAYATGRRPLRDKLERVTLVTRRDRPAQKRARGALEIAQLLHNGDWNPDPHALIYLSRYLNSAAGLDVVAALQPVDPADNALFGYPVVYMTGHFSFELTEAQRAGLKTYLRRGGFLFAEACCGRKPFDTSFRKLMGQLFPEYRLEALGANHPILEGKLGFGVGKISYRPAVRKESPALHTVRLFGVTIGGRTAVVYSPYGLECGWVDHACLTCRGLQPEDSKKLAANIILYAISY